MHRINAGHLMVMLGATALLVSLFIDWYEPGLSAWAVFEVADVVMAGLAILALWAALPMRLPGDVGAQTERLERSLPWIGVAALLFVAVTLIDKPPAARDLPLEFGAWLGLIGAALMTVGGFLTTSRVSIVVSSRPAPVTAATPTPAERVERDGTTATRPLGDEPPPPPPAA